jgi:hypothetical protein
MNDEKGTTYYPTTFLNLIAARQLNLIAVRQLNLIAVRQLILIAARQLNLVIRWLWCKAHC